MTTGVVLTLSLPLSGVLSGTAAAQQRANSDFVVEVTNPTWPMGTGPVALVDEAHNNYHTADGRYAPFARLLRADGWRVSGHAAPLTLDGLARARLLVVANPLHERNVAEWVTPTPSAFTDEEIDVVRRWVEEGGALLLIADHMPFPGAAGALGAAFGFEMRNGFAIEPPAPSVLVFRRSDGSLASHPVTDGTSTEEHIDSVATFVGQGFRVPDGATSILTFSDRAVSLEPDTAWQFNDETPAVPLAGWSQGAVLQVGEGRVAVWGEAAGFTAQLGGPGGQPIGMALPVAGQNARFVLNLVRWLVEDPPEG